MNWTVARLDVWIGGGWVRGMHLIADYKKRQLWECVQDAIKAYVAANAKITVAPKDQVAGNEGRFIFCKFVRKSSRIQRIFLWKTRAIS